MIQQLILSSFILFGLFVLTLAIFFRLKGIDFWGVPPIKKSAFYLGKISSLFTWSFMIVQALGLNLRRFKLPLWIEFLSAVLLVTGFIMLLIAFVRLRHSTRFGIPRENIKLETGGIYAVSRNPMYLGFYLLYVASVLYTFNPLVFTFAIAAVYAHNRTAVAEEKFLEKKFGNEYADYKKRVRRYV